MRRHSTPGAGHEASEGGRAQPRLGVVVQDQPALAPNLRGVRERRLQLVVEAGAGEREVELRAGPLVRAQHVALAQPGRASRDAPTVEHGDLHAAASELERDADTRDAGADDDHVGVHQRAGIANPAGNGSSGSSRYWPMPVIQARPSMRGTIAGCPATSVSRTIVPVKRVPMREAFTYG